MLQKTIDYKYPYIAIRAALRRLKVRNVSRNMTNIMQLALAAEEHKIPLTVELVMWFFNKKSRTSVTTALHSLGDRRALTLIRRDSHRFEWIVSPIFKKQLDSIKRGEKHERDDF